MSRLCQSNKYVEPFGALLYIMKELILLDDGTKVYGIVENVVFNENTNRYDGTYLDMKVSFYNNFWA